MADAIYGALLLVRKGRTRPLPAPHHQLLPSAAALTLLATVDASGETSLDALARAIPECDRPISAVLLLVDAGLLALDTATAFDATCRVTRTNAPRA